MNNYSPFYMLSYAILIISALMAMSSSNWLMLWMSLELNLLAFIPILLKSNLFLETEAAIKYFLIQAIGSSLLLMSSMFLWFSDQMPNSMSLIMFTAMAFKIGLAPCHLWYPSVMASISWNSALLLSTWQKLAPLMVMSFLVPNSKIMLIVASLNAVTGGVMGMNQSQLRNIMAYSSITHLGWMMALIAFIMPYSCILYFMMYSIIIIPIFMVFSANNVMLTNQLNSPSMNFSMNLMMLSILFISLGGLPPMLGFFPKLMSINLLMNNSTVLLLTLILGSLMNLYFYLNIVFSSLLTSISNNKYIFNFKDLSYQNSTFITISFLFLPMMIMM